MVNTMLEMLWTVVKYPLYVFLFLIALFILAVAVWFVYGLTKGRRLKKGSHRAIKKSGLFKQLFWESPRQYVDDLFDTDPDFFKYQGLCIYTGSQGNGKTISMVHDMMIMQEEYPRAKCITNLAYKYEDDVLSHWSQLVEYKNGVYGVIVALDEIQNWFSSKQSKDFPPQMFEVITQNRKNRRIILATAQNFYQVAKDIRAQTVEVRKCVTFFGVFTIVHRVRPILDADGNVTQWKHIKYHTFAHTKGLRDAYDTYKVIESLMKSGFKERPVIGDT